MATEITTTCQVCGNRVKSKSGLIAHHGYRRPYEGWQTASCEGARYLPYEKSCERLIEVAAMMKTFIETQEAAFESFLATSPQVISVLERRGSYDTGKLVEYTKPEAFDKNHYYSSIPRTYENAYGHRKYSYEDTIRAAKRDYSTMQRRIEEWEVKVC